MPIAWNENPDSPPAFEALGSFVGGQVSYSKPRLLADNQAALLQNCEIAITGQVSTRFGTTQVGGTIGAGSKIDAIFYFNVPGTSTYEVAITNARLYKNTSSPWVLIDLFTTSDVPSIVQGANKLYLAGGADVFSCDGTTLTNLSGDGATQAPRNASILLWHMNRLVAAGPLIKGISTDPVVPDGIYFSNILDGATWGTTKTANQLRVGAGDGVAIVAIIPWMQTTLAVFKRHSIYVVNADPSLAVADMPIQPVSSTVGCCARKTPVQIGSEIYFLSDDGVRRLSYSLGSDQRQELSPPLSYPVQDYINRINWSAVGQNACACFWRNLYMLSLPLDSSSTNNFVLVYNTITQSWTGVWTNLPINCFGIREVSGVTRMMAGLATSNIVIDYNDYVNPANWVDATFQDYNSSAVQPRITTKSYVFNEPLAAKLGKGGEIQFNNSNGTLSMNFIKDEVTVVGPTIDVSSGGIVLPATPPFTIAPNGLSKKPFDLLQYGEFRELQYDIQGLTGGRKEIRQLSTAAIIRPSTVGQS